MIIEMKAIEQYCRGTVKGCYGVLVCDKTSMCDFHLVIFVFVHNATTRN